MSREVLYEAVIFKILLMQEKRRIGWVSLKNGIKAVI